MKISVIMATLNAGRFLAEALDSINGQTKPPTEILLVDGGSTDDTQNIARRYPDVRLITQSGSGLPDAWNTGIAAAAGEYIAFLDSDDHWTSNKLNIQASLLNGDPFLQAVVGHVRFFLEPGCERPLGFRPELFEGTYAAPMPGALLIRREALNLVGLFDTRFPVACDIDWFSRLRDLQIKLATLPDLLIHKRIHQTNLSLTTDSKPTYSKELVQLIFEKRRRVALQKQ